MRFRETIVAASLLAPSKKINPSKIISEFFLSSPLPISTLSSLVETKLKFAELRISEDSVNNRARSFAAIRFTLFDLIFPFLFDTHTITPSTPRQLTTLTFVCHTNVFSYTTDRFDRSKNHPPPTQPPIDSFLDWKETNKARRFTRPLPQNGKTEKNLWKKRKRKRKKRKRKKRAGLHHPRSSLEFTN